MDEGQGSGFTGLLRGRLKEAGSEAHVYADTYYRKKTEEDSEKKRKANYQDVVTRYYDIATDFYEYGWGQSFHFAAMRIGEPLSRAITRHEHRIALKLRAEKGMKLLDVGCGVGGPAREIASVSDAQVVGINISEYQVQRATHHTKRCQLENLCSFTQGDFMNLPFQNNTFDGAFAIEATCHAPDKVAAYKEIFRVLKPSCYFACYEWVLSETFDGSNTTHQRVLHDVLEGNGLPNLLTKDETREAVLQAGFEIIEFEDFVDRSVIPWYSPLEGTSLFSLEGFRSSWLGRLVTHVLLVALESCHLAPKGSTKTHEILRKAGDGLVEAGKLKIFSPMLFFLARKPEN